jgi:HAD superfamily hydrolase (TIGR01509 family)
MKADYQGIIFDMDGVLVDSEPIHAKSWELVFREIGYDYPPDWFLQWIGISDRKLTRYVKEHCRTSLSADQILLKKRETYQQVSTRELRLFDGLLAALDRLENFPQAVATSSTRKEAAHTLHAAGIGTRFALLVGADDVENHKPFPDPYLKAASLLNLPPEKCVALDDSPPGVQSAKSAGCFTLGIGTSHDREKLAEADLFFSSTSAALEWFLGQECPSQVFPSNGIA